MKSARLTSIVCSTFLAVGLMIGSHSSTLLAAVQSGGTLARVTIPFNFQDDSQQMLAGVYRIERESKYLLLLHGPSNTSSYILMHPAMAPRMPSRGSIVFDRVGGKYVLRQIWTAGDKEGLECTTSRAEKEIGLAKNEQKQSSVVEIAFAAESQR